MTFKKYKNINRYLIDKGVESFEKNIENGKTVLDVGAGRNHYRKVFSRNNYITIDIGLEQKNNKGIDIVGDILDMPLNDSSIDYIICIEVIEHMADGSHLLKEMNRVIKKGGKLLITFPLCFGEHMEPYDYFRYTQYSMKDMLEVNGFSVLEIKKRGGYFTLLGFFAAGVPDQIAKTGKIPALIRKPLKRLLRFPFTYFLAPIFIKLDLLDQRKNFTLGYIFEVQKIDSIIL
jgi:SAM-dependent methyltransferase